VSVTRKILVVVTLLAITAGGFSVFYVARALRHPIASYAQAIESVRQVCPDAQEFKNLFPSSSDFISYYTGEAGSPEWNSTIENGELEIHAQMSLSLDAQRQNVTHCGPMRIFVLRIESIQMLSGGRESRQYSDQKIYSLEQLKSKLHGITDPESRLKELLR
jgi:hypothetical protein